MTGHDGVRTPGAGCRGKGTIPKREVQRLGQAYQRKGTRILWQITGSESRFGRGQGAKRDLQSDLPEDGGAGPFSSPSRAPKIHRRRGLRMPSHSFALPAWASCVRGICGEVGGPVTL